MARTAKHLSEPSLFVDDWQPQISSTKSRGERHCDVRDNAHVEHTTMVSRLAMGSGEKGEC
jgi:hypothetical protein